MSDGDNYEEKLVEGRQSMVEEWNDLCRKIGEGLDKMINIFLKKMRVTTPHSSVGKNAQAERGQVPRP